MALGTGISYRDWMNKINDIQQFGIKEINLSLTSGTELIDIKNIVTPRIKEISRITPISMEPTLYPPTGHSFGIALSLDMTNTGRINIYDGQLGMTVGCVAVIGHNLSLTNGGDPNDIYIEVYLKDEVGFTIATESTKILDGQYEDKSIYFSLSQVYTGVYTVEINIIADAQLLNNDFEIGRVWIGNYLEACIDSNYDIGFVQGIGSRRSQSYDFSLIADDKINGTGANWLDFAKESSSIKEYTSIGQDSYLITKSDFIIFPRVSTDDELKTYPTYCKLTRPFKLSHVNGPYWETSVDVIGLV